MIEQTRPEILLKFAMANGRAVRANVQQPRLYTAMVLISISYEVLGLYGLIVSILMPSRSASGVIICRF